MTSTSSQVNTQADVICVLLATFNGEQFIAKQLDSILSQTHQSIVIIIRDDGSTDNTLTILSEYQARFQNIIIHKNETGQGSPVSNFSALTKIALQTSYVYFCFADQDDVWLKDKLKTQLSGIKKIETEMSERMPCLLHSDMQVIDAHDEVISPSFVSFQDMPDPVDYSFDKLLSRNIATGCTMMFNRAQLEIAAPIPCCAIIHDWWFALTAKLYGNLSYIDTPLIQYRKHAGNAIGPMSKLEQMNPFGTYLIKMLKRYPQVLKSSIAQARELLTSPKKEIHDYEQSILIEYANLNSKSIMAKLAFASNYLCPNRPVTQRLYIYLCVLFVIN